MGPIFDENDIRFLKRAFAVFVLLVLGLGFGIGYLFFG